MSFVKIILEELFYPIPILAIMGMILFINTAANYGTSRKFFLFNLCALFSHRNNKIKRGKLEKTSQNLYFLCFLTCGMLVWRIALNLETGRYFSSLYLLAIIWTIFFFEHFLFMKWHRYSNVILLIFTSLVMTCLLKTIRIPREKPFWVVSEILRKDFSANKGKNAFIWGLCGQAKQVGFFSKVLDKSLADFQDGRLVGLRQLEHALRNNSIHADEIQYVITRENKSEPLWLNAYWKDEVGIEIKSSLVYQTSYTSDTFLRLYRIDSVALAGEVAIPTSSPSEQRKNLLVGGDFEIPSSPQVEKQFRHNWKTWCGKSYLENSFVPANWLANWTHWEKIPTEERSAISIEVKELFDSKMISPRHSLQIVANKPIVFFQRQLFSVKDDYLLSFLAKGEVGSRIKIGLYQYDNNMKYTKDVSIVTFKLPDHQLRKFSAVLYKEIFSKNSTQFRFYIESIGNITVDDFHLSKIN